MKELIGRLGRLDSDASESLKAIAYFDSLLEGQAGLESFVRGAAALTGCIAGVSDPRALSIRCAPAGHRLPVPADPAADWPSKPLWHGADSFAWIERDGECSPTDDMVLERFAAGARITLERICGDLFDDRASVELLLDVAVQADARRRAAARLRIGDPTRLRVVARAPVQTSQMSAFSTVMDTPYGSVLASIEGAKPQAGHGAEIDTRTGIGPWGDLSELPRSWEKALVALRMTTSLTRVVMYEELGALAALASLSEAASAHPDVQRLTELATEHSWALDTLEAVAMRETGRGSATLLGIHHSTLQARLAALEVRLGYDTSTPGAHVRLGVALALYRLSHSQLQSDGVGRRRPRSLDAVTRSIESAPATSAFRKTAG